MKTINRGLLAVLIMIGVTSVALGYMGQNESVIKKPAIKPVGQKEGVVSVDARLVQDKVLQGAGGNVSVSLTLVGDNIPSQIETKMQPVDLVVVLDRSGSMDGQKIADARLAVIRLLERMGAQDRMAVITYSDRANLLAPLTHINPNNLENLIARVSHIEPDGGTNLGDGLQYGIDLLHKTPGDYRQRKVILISDGLANQGIVSPYALGSMASRAAELNFGISTVGVGYDFNEELMTAIADHGAGNYYFLENPQAFARVFEKEFESARNVVASGLEVKIPLPAGVELLDAGGFPIARESNYAVVRPGDLLAGQERKLFLTYQISSGQKKDISLGNIEVSYLHKDTNYAAHCNNALKVAFVEDEKEVVASIDKDAWSEQVIKEDYNKLKDQVAKAIRKGNKEEAMQNIAEYESKNSALNDSVGSRTVATNLEEDVQQLKKGVEETFAGAPAAVAAKSKQQAKLLQYESYQERRDKK